MGGKKAGQIVGRITAQIDTMHRERYGEDTGHFGMIDAIDDPQVFAALFGAAEAWLKSQGASKISGPFSLNINQESGLLIEGFDTPPCAMMPHGKPWYAAHIEQLGYHKGIDLLAWWMQRTDLTFSPALKKLMDQVRKKVTIRCINRQRFAEEMQILREIFNSGWQHNWGFVPFTEHEFATMGDQLKYLVPDDIIYIAEIDSAPCAFIVGLPNHQRGDCRSERIALSLRLGKIAVAFESQRCANCTSTADGRAGRVSVQPHRPGDCAVID